MTVHGLVGLHMQMLLGLTRVSSCFGCMVLVILTMLMAGTARPPVLDYNPLHYLRVTDSCRQLGRSKEHPREDGPEEGMVVGQRRSACRCVFGRATGSSWASGVPQERRVIICLRMKLDCYTENPKDV